MYIKNTDFFHWFIYLNISDDLIATQFETNKHKKDASIQKKSKQHEDHKEKPRNRTATLSRGEKIQQSNTISPHKKEYKNDEKQQREKYGQKHDPRKKEKELEKKAKESLEKTYQLSSLIKNQTPKKKSPGYTMEKMSRKHPINKTPKEEGEQSNYYGMKNFGVNLSQSYTTEMPNEFNVTNLKEVKHNKEESVDCMAAGDSLVGETSENTNDEDDNDYEDDFEVRKTFF